MIAEGRRITRMNTKGITSTSAGPRVAWHSLDPEEVLERLSATRNGLSPEEVEARLLRYGENALPTRKPPTLVGIFLHQFKSPLIYILLAAAAVSLALQEFTDAGFIFVVLLLNAALGTIQEWNAERSAASLQKMLEIVARVRRSGHNSTVPAQQLVPGDVVLIESGDRVPADLRLVEGNNLSIDESFLTGENIAPIKRLGKLPEGSALGDQVNMAFAGSMVMSGRGVGVVVATASATQVGQIASTVAFAASAKPPLLQRMEKFARQISYFVGAAVLLLAVVALLKGMVPVEVFFLAVALAVSAIPEGLPVAMTVALSIGVRRMARRNVIVRKLPAVEGLGSCTCIASDKTGTLTVNQQTVKAITLFGVGRLTVEGEGLDPIGAVGPERGELTQAGRNLLEQLTTAGVLCNEGELSRSDDGTWRLRGDAMDVALLVLAQKTGVVPAKVRAGVERLGEIPYESERKYAASFYRASGRVQVALKGAWETVLGFCDRVRTPDGDHPLDTATIEEEGIALAIEGYRVLAIAVGEAPSVPQAPAQEGDVPKLALLGLAGFLDPLRPEAKDAVAKCQRAGIRVVMVTGDHPATAFALSKDLGIADDRSQVVTGVELAGMTAGSDEHRNGVSTARVFARVSPLQKLEIVDALIEEGHFVAVTGDGVNDAPALKKANIGIAMGSGTEVAKDTASLVITDDNFASIEAGVEEGRFAYDNVRKVTYLLISCGLAEVLLFTASLLAGLPLPLTAVQLLWLNLVTNGIQDVALAFEAGEPGAMQRPPRRPTEGMFNSLMTQQTVVSGLAMAALCFGSWYWLLSTGMPDAEARNLLLLLFVLCQNVHVFSVRSEYASAFRVPISRNYVLFFGVLAAQGLHLLCMNLPPMQKILGVSAVNLRQWATALALAGVMLVVMEVFKLLRRRCGTTPPGE